MFTTITTTTLSGITCQKITIEVDVTKSWPGFQIVGLADTAIQEAKERIRAAWNNSGFTFPNSHRITINLAPASIKKIGTAYDLPIAIGMYIATHAIKSPLQNALCIGELSLNGHVRYTQGILATMQFAHTHNIHNVYIPSPCLEEAMLVPDLHIFPITSFKQLCQHIEGSQQITPIITNKKQSFLFTKQKPEHAIDFEDIRGNIHAKRALEIAAAGGHNILFSGPPGSGKTLLSQALPSILPPLTHKELIEVTNIHSIASTNNTANPAIITTRPYRAPHHTSSQTALIGGGSIPRPGEVTLAHRGVLFLDELPEFSRATIEALRQPLENRYVTIARAQMSVRFPASFILVASKNPCPCGYATDPHKTCTCLPHIVQKYNHKLSGPLLDRFDIFVEVSPIPITELSISNTQAESSTDIKKRVLKVCTYQKVRYKHTDINSNAELNPKTIHTFAPLTEEANQILSHAAQKMHLSARSYYKIIKVARTIADFEHAPKIQKVHLAEALSYRINL